MAFATDEPLPPLGFGCGAVMGRAGKAQSLRALHVAWENGINFFDVARAYGYGAAEGVLGEFLRGRRQNAIICTKFGTLPAKRSPLKSAMLPIARKAVHFFPRLRKVAQRGAGTQFSTNQFGVAGLKESIATSLRELRTDYVDMLLLHAAPPDALRRDDLMEALQRLVESGSVRMAGLSGPRETMDAYFHNPPPVLATAQFACNVLEMGILKQTRAAASRGLCLVANHPFGGPQGVEESMRRVSLLRARPEISSELREKLHSGDKQLMPELLLQCILRDTGVASVVPAMVREEHILSNLRAVRESRFTDQEITVLRQTLEQGAGPADDRQGAGKAQPA